MLAIRFAFFSYAKNLKWLPNRALSRYDCLLNPRLQGDHLRTGYSRMSAIHLLNFRPSDFLVSTAFSESEASTAPASPALLAAEDAALKPTALSAVRVGSRLRQSARLRSSLRRSPQKGATSAHGSPTAKGRSGLVSDPSERPESAAADFEEPQPGGPSPTVAQADLLQWVEDSCRDVCECGSPATEEQERAVEYQAGGPATSKLDSQAASPCAQQRQQPQDGADQGQPGGVLRTSHTPVDQPQLECTPQSGCFAEQQQQVEPENPSTGHHSPCDQQLHHPFTTVTEPSPSSRVQDTRLQQQASWSCRARLFLR